MRELLLIESVSISTISCWLNIFLPFHGTFSRHGKVSLLSIYFCGGSCIEEVTTHLMNHDYLIISLLIKLIELS